jgi:long-chain fatty acid transport protein
MKRHIPIALIAGGLVLAAAGSASAGGFALSEQSAVAGGTAGASTARDGDSGAAWYNPAALADGAGLRFGAGLLAALPSVHAEAMDGAWRTDSASSVSTPPQLHASFAHDGLAYGLAVGVPFGGGVTWPEDWPGRHEIISSRLEVVRAAPFVAFRWNKLRFAVGFHVDFGRMRIQRSLDFVDTEGDVHLDMDGRSYGFDLAAYYDVSRELAVGASFKSGGTLELAGGADFEAPDAFNMKTADQHVGTSLELPDRLAIGTRWARGKLAVLGDVEITNWSGYDSLVIDFENDVTPDTTLTTGWNTTVGVRTGAEYAVRPATIVRGGAFYDPSPAPDDNLAPSSPDSTRLGATVGVSHQLRTDVAVDAFYEYMHLRARETSSMDSLQARYGGRAQILGVGVRLHR